MIQAPIPGPRQPPRRERERARVRPTSRIGESGRRPRVVASQELRVGLRERRRAPDSASSSPGASGN